MNSDLGRITLALQALVGSLVVHVTIDQVAMWTYKHPTIGDALSEVTRHNPELLGVFLAGSDVERLSQQVTCGNVGIERAVVLPAKLFPQMIDRLSSYQSSPDFKTTWLSQWGARRTLYSFLAARCSKPFLELYLKKFPGLLDAVASPGLYLSWAPEVDLCCRLFELGLLPEEIRRRFLATVSKYAVDGVDASVLGYDSMRALFTKNDVEALRGALRNKLLPELGAVRERRQDQYAETDDSHQRSEEHTSELQSLMRNSYAVFRLKKTHTKT